MTSYVSIIIKKLTDRVHRSLVYFSRQNIEYEWMMRYLYKHRGVKYFRINQDDANAILFVVRDRARKNVP
jgi:hypothetical protein